MNSFYFSSNRIFPGLVLPETICRSTIEDTSYSTFSAVTAIPYCTLNLAQSIIYYVDMQHLRLFVDISSLSNCPRGTLILVCMLMFLVHKHIAEGHRTDSH